MASTGATQLQLWRGNLADLPAAAADGEPIWCLDANRFFLGTGGAPAVVAPQFSEVGTDAALTAVADPFRGDLAVVADSAAAGGGEQAYGYSGTQWVALITDTPARANTWTAFQDVEPFTQTPPGTIDVTQTNVQQCTLTAATTAAVAGTIGATLSAYVETIVTHGGNALTLPAAWDPDTHFAQPTTDPFVFAIRILPGNVPRFIGVR